MKCYFIDDLPDCRKALVSIKPSGITVDSGYLDFFSGGLHPPEYLAVSPNGRFGNDASQFPNSVITLD